MTEKMYSRAGSAAPKSTNDAERSVEFIAATESPVPMMDWTRGVVDEILLVDGCEIPANGQVPLLDSHERSSVDYQLGSFRDFKKSSPDLLGRAYFSRKQKAFDCFRDVADGHITDVSVGYEVKEAIYADPGQAVSYQGKSYKAGENTLKVTTKWALKEVSITPIGADVKAKSRSEETHQDEKPPENTGQISQEENPMPIEPVAPPISPAPVVDTEAIRAEAERAAIKRVTDIQDACRAAGVEDIISRLVTDCKTLDTARAEIINELAKRKPVAPVTISMGVTDNEKFRAKAIDGLIERGGTRLSNPTPGYEEYRGKSLLRLAEDCLKRAGVNTNSMSGSQIASAVLKREYTIAAGTADFAAIVLDAANKSLQRGYEDGPFFWRMIASVNSASDFKNINRISLFEAPDLVQINEQGEYTEAKFLSGKEVYALTSNGLRFTISRVAIINDDASAFSRIPRLLGATATRKIEKTVIGLLTANSGLGATMADTHPVFYSTHNNIGTGAALSAASISADRGLMLKQQGRGADGSTTPAFVIPRYSLVPAALAGDNEIACFSMANPASESNSGVINPVAKAGIIPLASPLLDMSDATRRYLLADPNQYDTLEVSFLDGIQTPYLEEVDQTDADGRVFKVRLDVGAGVLDWRGLVTNAGK